MSRTPPASLEGWVEGVRQHLATRLVRVAIIWIMASVALMLIVAWTGAGARGWSRASVLPLLLDVLGLAALLAGGRLVHRWRKRWLNGEAIGRELERQAGLADGLVRSALELSAGSPGLIQQARAGVLASLAQGVRGDGLGVPGEMLATWMKRGVVISGVAGATALALLGASPERARGAWGGLASPFAVLAGPALPALEVSPGNVEVPRGQDLEIAVHAAGRSEVTLVWQAEGDVAHREALAVEQGAASARILAITAAVTYRVEAPDGAASQTFTAEPIDPLFVDDVEIALSFPEHTGRAPEVWRGEVPSLDVPVGTRLTIQGQGSRPLGRAALVNRGGGAMEGVDVASTEGLELQIDEQRFFGDWVPRASGQWRWDLRDLDGMPAGAPPPDVVLRLQPDQPPGVQLIEPAPEAELPLNQRQALIIQAGDDYGVAWLELVAWRVPALGEPQPPIRQRLDTGGVPRVLLRPVMDVSQWGLVAGDEVHYFVRVQDNHPRGQQARTETAILRLASADELREDAGDELQAAAEALAALRDEAQEAAREARDAQREAAAPARDDEAAGSPTSDGQETGFEEREALREALEAADARAGQVDSLRAVLEALNEAMAQAGAANPGLREDLQEVSELLSQAGEPGAQAELAELLAGMEGLGREEAAQMLEQLAGDQQRLQQQLEEAAKRLERAAVRQEFTAVSQSANDLARRQQALAESMMEEASAKRAEQQDALANEAEAAAERAAALEERLASIDESQAAEAVAAANQSLAESVENMREASSAAKQGDARTAGERAEQAAQQMAGASQQLDQAEQQLSEQRARAFHAALQQTAHDLLSLARQQGDMLARIHAADRGVLAEMRTEVAAVEQGAERVARQLAGAARTARAGGAERPILDAIGVGLVRLRTTVETLDRPSVARGSGPAQTGALALDALNEGARLALATADEISQGGASSQTPSPEQAMEQLQELAQDQADLNNQATQMMPMDLTPTARDEQMQQMAQQQQQIADQVGDMAQQEGEGPLGDLEALAREAEALAEALQQGRLDATTRERQERLFHRLLDAGRSMQRDGETPERESEVGAQVERGLIAPLDAEALGIARYRPDPVALQQLSPAARALVLRYFRSLNETRSGGAR